MSRAFKNEVIFRYGTPLVVRSDKGTEFEGDFIELMERYNILHI